ncbi:aldo/keto reductase [Pelagibacterium halotolerans]|uniref:Oxidoreductase of aldo/keto reductase family, subgroup 1 n=1 Tax=Pelagibacterium halotolerans (strain DSM 22347 / JCM 15775 / CGMCC 1.7692 / B2) TaxID=1082931 RepID=G4RGT6_PELHB|nr:aldo/keto reductase [Pelagibacterium halotolerans]AEQ52125.1 oxidoreductase of aldo/keto reductase family, subgroup 1 [Pelagibacterium halotolerans B2]QJR18106.1 aldo/keto reductase [Pelagibacterium halotolerans]SDZ84048.1 2,5-diketo-D-gluconate reductase A [Pelagibacterium halotolerans]
MTQQSFIELSDGNTIPQVGLGTWKLDSANMQAVVEAAIAAGYRHFDTAYAYRNEAALGAALKASGVGEDELFITSKLPSGRHGFESTLRTFDETMANLGVDVLDLYLIHWPMPKTGNFVDTFKAFITLKEEGRIKSIGVSNFHQAHLEKLMKETGVTPVVNQIELSPAFQQKELRAFNEKHGITTESWSPLGRGDVLENPTIREIAQKHGRTPGQVTIRWHIQNGLIVIPKSANPQRIAENFGVFDFALDDEDMGKIATLDSVDGRTGVNPDEGEFLQV